MFLNRRVFGIGMAATAASLFFLVPLLPVALALGTLVVAYELGSDVSIGEENAHGEEGDRSHQTERLTDEGNLTATHFTLEHATGHLSTGALFGALPALRFGASMVLVKLFIGEARTLGTGLGFLALVEAFWAFVGALLYIGHRAYRGKSAQPLWAAAGWALALTLTGTPLWLGMAGLEQAAEVAAWVLAGLFIAGTIVGGYWLFKMLSPSDLSVPGLSFIAERPGESEEK